MRLLNISAEPRICFLRHPRPTSTRHQGKLHEDISPGDFLSTQQLPTIRRCLQLTFKEPIMSLEIRFQKERGDFARDRICDRFDEERHRRVLDV